MELEAAISLAASIADSLQLTAATIDLFAAGPDLYLFQTQTGETHFEAILEIMAAIESTSHNPLEQLTPAILESIESMSVLICLFVDWDDSREELVQRAVEAGLALKVFLVRERPPTSEFPQRENFMQIIPKDVLAGAVDQL